MRHLAFLILLLVGSSFTSFSDADEVRSQLAASPIQFPGGCLLKRENGCAIQTRRNETFRLKDEKGEIRLDENSIVIADFDRQILTLVQGWVWVVELSNWTIRTELGQAQGQGQGSYWVHRSKTDMQVLGYLSSVVVTSRLGQSMRVEPGQYNWLGRPRHDGETSSGVPQPISYYEQVARVARLFKGSVKDLDEEVAAFAKVWKSAVKITAETSRINGERRIASVKEQEELEERRRQYLIRQRDARRNLMYKKIYLDE